MRDFGNSCIAYFVLGSRRQKLAKNFGEGNSYHLYQTFYNVVASITLTGSLLCANVLVRGSSNEKALQVTCCVSLFKRKIQSRSRM